MLFFEGQSFQPDHTGPLINEGEIIEVNPTTFDKCPFQHSADVSFYGTATGCCYHFFG